jgi:hypothetical protein
LSKRFEIKNKIVSDLKTGLVWSLDAALSIFPLTWNEAFEYIKDLNAQSFQDFNDWRLPSRTELFSLVSHSYINPCLPKGHPFENVFPGYYWTSTTCARLPDQAWYIHLGEARVYRGMKHASCMVWPVRGRHYQDIEKDQTRERKKRFAKKGHLATDLATGLTWPLRASLSTGPVAWKQALEIIQRINKEKAFGFSDWRLPHIREAESLVDLKTHSPALPSDHPFEDIYDFYWSSTTSLYETRYAWVLYLKDGAVGVGFKQNQEFYVWPVRGENRFFTNLSGLT